MRRMMRTGQNIKFSLNKAEKSTLQSVMERISASDMDAIHDYIASRVSKLNTVTAQIIGHVPLSAGEQRTESDWGGTVLNPLCKDTSHFKSAAYLGLILKQWFINQDEKVIGKWMVSHTGHWWMEVEVNVYFRVKS